MVKYGSSGVDWARTRCPSQLTSEDELSLLDTLMTSFRLTRPYTTQVVLPTRMLNEQLV